MNDIDQQIDPPIAEKKVDIATLYPTAKSYDESALELSVIKQRREVRVDKETRFGPIYIAVGWSLTMMLSIYAINYIPHLLDSDPLGGPRTALILMIAVVALHIFISWQIVRYAELKAGRSLIFFAAYLVSFAPELYAWRVFEPLGKYDPNAMIAVTIADFIIVFILSWVVFSKRFSATVRTAVICMVIATSLVAAFIIGRTQTDIQQPSAPDSMLLDGQSFPSI